MIICNLVRIRNATSLHTRAPMAQKKGQKTSEIAKLSWFFCLILGLARSLCAFPTPCNFCKVTNRTQCDNMQLGSHWTYI